MRRRRRIRNPGLGWPAKVGIGIGAVYVTGVVAGLAWRNSLSDSLKWPFYIPFLVAMSVGNLNLNRGPVRPVRVLPPGTVAPSLEVGRAPMGFQ